MNNPHNYNYPLLALIKDSTCEFRMQRPALFSFRAYSAAAIITSRGIP